MTIFSADFFPTLTFRYDKQLQGKGTNKLKKYASNKTWDKKWPKLHLRQYTFSEMLHILMIKTIWNKRWVKNLIGLI